MKACVFDTHALVWYLATPRKLGRRARAILREVESGRRRGWIPVAVAVELVVLHERGRSEIGLPELAATIERNPELQVLPLDLEQVQEFAALRTIRDPFDRLVAAAALAAECPLVSRDSGLGALGAVEVVWD